jgi:hypothetical protein
MALGAGEEFAKERLHKDGRGAGPNAMRELRGQNSWAPYAPYPKRH